MGVTNTVSPNCLAMYNEAVILLSSGVFSFSVDGSSQRMYLKNSWSHT